MGRNTQAPFDAGLIGALPFVTVLKWSYGNSADDIGRRAIRLLPESRPIWLPLTEGLHEATFVK